MLLRGARRGGDRGFYERSEFGEGHPNLITLQGTPLRFDRLQHRSIDARLSIRSLRHREMDQRAVHEPRQLSRGNARPRRGVVRLGGHQVEEKLDSSGPDRSTLLDETHPISTKGPIAEEAEEGLGDRMTGSKVIDLLL